MRSADFVCARLLTIRKEKSNDAQQNVKKSYFTLRNTVYET